MKSVTYLYIVKSRVKFFLEFAKRCFYRAEIGRIASEEVTLHITKSKRLTVLLYGLEVCPLNVSDLLWVDLIKSASMSVRPYVRTYIQGGPKAEPRF